MNSPSTDRLSSSEWAARARRHRARLSGVVSDHLDRKQRGDRHPVVDFLFTYYSFRPGPLLRWSPGIGTILEGEEARRFLADSRFTAVADGVRLHPDEFPRDLIRSTRWIRDLLTATQSRTAGFGCHGLHEWAMVYQSPEVRHAAVPMRVSPDEVAALLDEQPIVCSHYDAYRFFTDPARPLNRLRPTADAVQRMEQPGCLHANMDVYRWAYKRWPWIPSDITADAFLLAAEIREMDMRASPYDLSAFGYTPIAVETEEGRIEYRRQQKQFSDRARTVRGHLIDAYDRLLAAVT